MLELCVVEAEEVVHDDVAGQSWEGRGQVQWLFPGFKLLHAGGEGVCMAEDDVNEVEDGAAGKPWAVSG